MARRKKKPKAVNYRVLSRDEEPELYELMDALVAKHHDELRDANIAIAWRHGWNPDPDGRLTLGQLKKASDLDRQLHGHDFVMLLNHDAWWAASFTKEMKLALIDHELSHGAIAYDEDLQPKLDDDGNIVYRLRKHDLEEFADVVRRHGLWRHDLLRFAEAALEAKRHPLLVDPKRDAALHKAVEGLRPKKGSGIDSVTLEVPGEEPVTLEAR